LVGPKGVLASYKDQNLIPSLETLEEVYEPFLIQEGFIVRTPRGREVTRFMNGFGVKGLMILRV
jgi:Holliday junction resolvasome RuvABC ATP-dependent DNA helicase subunit